MNNGFAPQVYEYLDWFANNFEEVKYRSTTEVFVRCPDPEGKHNNGDANPSLSMGISQNGKGPAIVINCVSQGCPKEAILKARGLALKDLYPPPQTGYSGAANRKSKSTALRGCTLEEYATYKNLPLEFLTSAEVDLKQTKYPKYPGEKDNEERVPAVRIPYPDETGRWSYTRFRVGLDDKKKVVGKSGESPILYGLHWLGDARKAGYVLLVEGESDCHVLWHHGRPALGIPGAGAWKDEWAHHLEGIPNIYVLVEPDEASEQMFKAIKTSTALAARVMRVEVCR